MSARYATARRTEPGEIILGEWAHVHYGGHHLIAEEGHTCRDPYTWADGRWQPIPREWRDENEITTACGRGFPRSFVWHDPPLPHLPRCKSCERAAAKR